ncbi:MAG: ComF family protein [Acidimicrobiales bacterium]
MVLDVLLDRRCPGCGRAHRAVCRACTARLERHRWVGRPPAVATAGSAVPVTALFVYDELVARLVLAAKNGGHRAVARCLGAWLGDALAHRARAGGEPDLVTWVPASPVHLRRRPYDQGEVLARSVAGRLGIPARNLLRRRDHRTQANLARPDRLRGPELIARSGPGRSARRKVRARSTGPPPGSARAPTRILLVDDVATTGASLARAADALTAAGWILTDAAVVAAAA